MAAARQRGESDAAVWLVGVAGARRPVRVRKVSGAATGPEPPLSVAEVAAAVDAGRDLAAAAAADGIAVLIAVAWGQSDPGGNVAAAAALDTGGAARSLLAAVAADATRPLRALRLLGTHELAVLCGIALGVGERGLGYAADGPGALAGAAVAAAIEPPLRARLLALTDHVQAAALGIATASAAELHAALG
jgi:NaMN:DMB phosphoribosyltransferase